MMLKIPILAGLAVILAFVFLMKHWGIASALGFVFATLMLAGTFSALASGDRTMPPVLAVAAVLCLVSAIIIRDSNSA